ncbi:MAG: hypothetical protein ACI8SE_000964 [Bacteroidia bacterium]|jgi:hypothetical protein
MKALIIAILLFLISLSSSAFQVTGKVTYAGEAMGHASIRVQGSTYGVITNGKGDFFMELPTGTYVLICEYVGMVAMKKEVHVKGRATVNFELTENKEVLNTLVIKTGGEDPAYDIVRKTIERKKSLNQDLESYIANVYIKASIEKENLKRPDTVDSKLVTKKKVNFIESYSDVYYKNGRFKEVKKAYKDLSEKQNSGGTVSVSFNETDPTQPGSVITPELFFTKITDGNFDFLKNRLDLATLGEMPITSPISNSALLSYKYKLEETFYEGDDVIAKISVIPKYSHSALFSGTIYISKKTHTLVSVNLDINPAALAFFDRFTVIQDYQLEDDSVLVPQRQEFYYDTKNGRHKTTYGHTLANYKNYNYNPTISNRFMSRGQVVYEDSSYDASLDFWQSIRPTGLKKIEQDFIHTQDSIVAHHKSDAYLDVQDSMYNSLNVWDFVLHGIVHRNREKGTRWYILPLIAQIQINNIDGYRHTLGGSYTKVWTKEKDLRLNGGLDYGITNKNIRGNIQARFMYDPKKFSRVRVKYENRYTMLNTRANISSTLSPSNFVENIGYGIGHEQEWWNGFFLSTYLDYNQYTPFKGKKLDELWDFFPDFSEPQYFEPFEELVLTMRARFTFKQQYEIRPYKKVITGSKYPVMDVTYTKGIKPLMKSDVNFDYLQLGTKYVFKMFKVGTTRLEAQAGRFLNDKEVRLSGLKYIRGSDKYYFSNPLQTAQLIEARGYQTSNGYIQAGLMHHFNGQILRKVPIIKHTGIQLATGANFMALEGGYVTLENEQSKGSIGHAEVLVGVERPVRMFKQMFRFGVYYAAGQNSNTGFNQGVKFGIDFYNTVSKLWQY